MDVALCSNCKSLREQCDKLETRVALLTEKVDKLLKLHPQDQSNKFAQTDDFITVFTSTQTDAVEVESISTNTESDNATINLPQISTDSLPQISNSTKDKPDSNIIPDIFGDVSLSTSYQDMGVNNDQKSIFNLTWNKI